MAAPTYWNNCDCAGAGVTELTQAALEPFRAAGLQTAMYLLPALGLLLTAVLFAGSRTITGDMERLKRWMLESSAARAPALDRGMAVPGVDPGQQRAS
jgi:hypothetical protein